MNLLLEAGLPEEIEGIPISPDFRNMIRFEMLLRDESLTEAERLYLGLSQLWPQIPEDANWALQKLLWFYGCGAKEHAPGRGARQPDRAYDFEQDAGMIYAGFYAAYGISLTTVDYLHWWEFMALLAGLPDTTQMGRIMYYRTVDLDQVEDKHQRQFLAEQKKHWALDSLIKTRRRTAEQVKQETLARARRRSEEVARLMREEQGG